MISVLVSKPHSAAMITQDLHNVLSHLPMMPFLVCRLQSILKYVLPILHNCLQVPCLRHINLLLQY